MVLIRTEASNEKWAAKEIEKRFLEPVVRLILDHPSYDTDSL